MKLRAVLITLACLTLVGCGLRLQPYSRGATPDQIETFAEENMSEDEAALIGRVYDAFLEHSPQNVFDDLPAHLRNDQSRARLVEIAGLLPGDPPSTIDQITYHRNHNTSGNETRLTVLTEWALTYPDGRVFAMSFNFIAFNEGPLRLEGARIVEAFPANWAEPESIGAVRITVAVVGALTPFLILGGIICAATAKRLRRRWLWLIACVLTFPTIQFNWSTEAFSILAPGASALTGNFQLMIWILSGTEISRSGEYHPWIMTIGVPIGALWFWVRYLTGTIARKPDPQIGRPEGTGTHGPSQADGGG